MTRANDKPKKRRRVKGFLNARIVRAFTFYIISACLIFSVIMCIMAIWEYADPDVFWRMMATFAVIAVGSAVFAFVNGIFGVDDDE